MNKEFVIPTIYIQTFNMKLKVSMLLIIAANFVLVASEMDKVVLTQFGVNQFLEYNVSIPELREFTFCVWLRIADITRDQPILSYFDNYKRYLHVWLKTGGMGIGVALEDGYQAIAPLSWNTGKWNQVCFSWNANVATWALYLNLKPVWCEQDLKLRGYIIPKGKRLAVGYGHTTFHQKGLEGEVFGFYMILCSTVMANDTFFTDVYHHVKASLRISATPPTNDAQQSPSLEKFSLKNIDSREYLENEIRDKEINNSLNTNMIQILEQKTADVSKRYHSFEMDIKDQSFPFKPVQPPVVDLSDSSSKETRNHNMDYKNLWELINIAGKRGKFKGNKHKGMEIVRSETMDQKITTALRKPLEVLKFNADSIYQLPPMSQSPTPFKSVRISNSSVTLPTISDKVEPPPIEKSKPVYGHWADFSFTKSVVDYFRKQNVETKSVKKNPVADLYPYATEQFKAVTIIPIPRVKSKTFKKRLSHFKPIDCCDRDHKILRREAKQPEINVKIIEDSSRERILLFHALTKPKKVNIVNRGTPPVKMFQSIDFDEEQLTFNDIYPSQDQISSETLNKLKENRLNTPKVKPNAYFVPSFIRNSNSSQSQYESIFTQSDLSNSGIPKTENRNTNFLKKPHPRGMVKSRINTTLKKNHLAKGIALAQSISKNSDTKLLSNHLLIDDNVIGNDLPYMTKSKGKKTSKQNETFHKTVKIGNALNEKHIIGEISKEKRNSFEGDEMIPDIQKYRSDIDNHIDNTVPPSLSRNVCKTNDVYSGIKLYIQNDGAINPSKIESPLKKESYAILFMNEHRKSCSLKPEVLKSIYRLIDWHQSPVRLFGGAVPRSQTRFCHLLDS